ncbi:hypothetical protein [Haloarcula sp. CBA1122]|uniref:hypothetical protein n=1 Tax=Haloarcula sp. CBA1122 TaxID=2668069 RepID=UPI00130747F7|nr:hypothetical protein [Haloarcula sp. CBA1122]MUV49736.1 hypothetical protein [Haloarcula sp. CBA1122]
MTITAEDVLNADIGPLCGSKYDASLSERINANRGKGISNEVCQAAKRSYEKCGLALLQLDDLSQPVGIIEQIAEGFGFDSGFVPTQYSEDEGLHNSFGINEISHDDESETDHEGFLSNGEQSVHVDGTLEPIGTVRRRLCCANLSQRLGVKAGFLIQ